MDASADSHPAGFPSSLFLSGRAEAASREADLAKVQTQPDPKILRAVELGRVAEAARKTGDEMAAERFYQEAADLAAEIVDRGMHAGWPEDARRELHRLGAQSAFACGNAELGFRWVDAWVGERGAADELEALRDVASWPDAWLVAAVRRSPSHEGALDALVQRYWGRLFSRCLLITGKRESAADLAQDTWCRVLRSRERLKPGGSFQGYVMMVATNLWRDAHRASLRAGALSESRLASIEESVSGSDSGSIRLGDVLPDLSLLEVERQRRLKLEIDEAIARLSPLARDVLIARHRDGESCASIARRYNRTEQTISGWVRRAAQDMKGFLESARDSAV